MMLIYSIMQLDSQTLSAPGADRFQVKPTLIKKDIDDLSDANFIELLRLKEGSIQRMVKRLIIIF